MKVWRDDVLVVALICAAVAFCATQIKSCAPQNPEMHYHQYGSSQG